MKLFLHLVHNLIIILLEIPEVCTPACGDHGVCSNSECFCESGWTGDDCSEGKSN